MTEREFDLSVSEIGMIAIWHRSTGRSCLQRRWEGASILLPCSLWTQRVLQKRPCRSKGRYHSNVTTHGPVGLGREVSYNEVLDVLLHTAESPGFGSDLIPGCTARICVDQHWLARIDYVDVASSALPLNRFLREVNHTGNGEPNLSGIQPSA